MLRHQQIHHHERSHRLHDGHRPRHDAGIMSSLGFQHPGLEVVAGGVLRSRDRRGRFERDAEVDVAAVGDAALDAATIIRAGG